MGNPFKKKLNRLTGRDNHSAAWKKGQETYFQSVGDRAANEKGLADAMKEYDNVPNTIRSTYIDTARKAGTYGDTDQFRSGLESEVLAGSRGARVGIAGRINALKKALGHTDKFEPEGLGQTQANQTQETIANAPSAPAEDSADSTLTPEQLLAKQRLSKNSVPLG